MCQGVRQLRAQYQHVKGVQNSFLQTTGEKADINQYWYTATTIAAIVSTLVRRGTVHVINPGAHC